VRDKLIELLCVKKVSTADAAQELHMTEAAVLEQCRIHEVNPRLWWFYVDIHCADCGAVHDSEKKLDEATRKRCLNRGFHCEACKKEKRREYDRKKAAALRERNREAYNAYIKQWREANPERWKEIQTKSQHKKRSS
jgi:hypothetical protein